MIHEREIRVEIARFLRGEISFEDFARWIMANSWNMRRDSSDEAVELASSVHLLLAERDDEIYSLAEFRNELASLLNNIKESVHAPVAEMVPPLPWKLSASSASWVLPPRLERLPVSA
jgi:hypothetical protein